MHVMIVEDDMLVAACLREIIKDMGWQSCSSVGDGTAAVGAAQKTPPSLAIVDLNIEGEIDGVETARRLHTQFSTSIIFLSGTSDRALIERMRTVPNVAFIEKPFLPGEIAQTVSAALEGRRDPITPGDA